MCGVDSETDQRGKYFLKNSKENADFMVEDLKA